MYKYIERQLLLMLWTDINEPIKVACCNRSRKITKVKLICNNMIYSAIPLVNWYRRWCICVVLYGHCSLIRSDTIDESMKQNHLSFMILISDNAHQPFITWPLILWSYHYCLLLLLLLLLYLSSKKIPNILMSIIFLWFLCLMSVWVIFIRSHCVCDDMFFDCLKKLNDTPAAQLMGSIYFNIVQVCVHETL